jgi:hypothetical protein
MPGRVQASNDDAFPMYRQEKSGVECPRVFFWHEKQKRVIIQHYPSLSRIIQVYPKSQKVVKSHYPACRKQIIEV